MPGLVIVSHSKNLANALVDLVKAAGAQDIPIAGVGGVGEKYQEFGTDGIAISEAIQRVFSPEGVLVLMDLGSAILNAEMAKDILPEEMQPHVHICSAPLVEGAISAAIQISLGSNLKIVKHEAQSALLPKAEQVGDTEAAAEMQGIPASDSWGETETLILTVLNEHGLHARPAARFVKVTASFDAEVVVKNLASGKGPVPANSLNSIATLGVRKGHQIEITAKGRETQKVLKALQQLAADNFGDEPGELQEIQQPSAIPQRRLCSYDIQGEPISDGIALGHIQKYHPPQPSIPDHLIDDPHEEWKRFEQALKATHKAIETEYLKIRSTVKGAADIFEAHLTLLDDPILLENTKRRIYDHQFNAFKSWKLSIDETEQSYKDLDDPYLQQRAADVRDVGNQLLHKLSGNESAAKIELSQPAILLARELTPTQTAQLDMKDVLGIVTQIGGPTSHSAILARSLGIPAVVCGDDRLFETTDGTFLALNGFDGAIWISPGQEIISELEQQKTHWLEQRETLYQTRHQLAVTKDGHHIEIAANIGNIAEAALAVESGAKSIGLLRSEFLYLFRSNAPDEEEQYEMLTRIGQIMEGKPVIIRTLDVGGDKDIPYLKLPKEDNPFLGVRALRLCLQRPEVFITQLKAILRAAEGTNFRIMFPMIALLEDFQRARQYLEEAHESLLKAGKPHKWPIETGIMIETPAAAVLSPSLAKQVDFFSIGTNDLTQYIFAADRGNQQLTEYSDALHPVVLRFIKQVVDASHNEGKFTGVCGELAGNPLAIPILAGMGVDELSMNPGAIPKAKAIIRELELKKARQFAQEALATDTGTHLQDIAKTFFTEHLPSELYAEF